jgi:2-C-methyl-D-erythritol 4-phosphate cytidylyltransferase
LLISAGCSPVIVVVPPGSSAAAQAALADRDNLVFVEGGGTRQESVANGLALVESESVVVHDAARPFASGKTIPELIQALVRFDGAITAIRVSETIKDVEGERVLMTVDRSRLWRAQTPQAFRTARLRAAHLRAVEHDIQATDDAQLVEAYGGAVGVVEGSHTNIKLTVPEDFALAEAMIAGGLV